MKKVALLMAAVLLTANVFAQEANTEVKKKAHWSMALKAGMDYYRIAPNLGSQWENASGTAGLMLDYTANPYWGMGLELTHSYFNRPKVDGHTTDAVLFTNIDITNIVAPMRKNNWQRFHFYTGAGLGAGYYDNTMADDYARDYKGHGWGGIFALNMTAEVKISDCWGFFADGEWRYYEKGEILGGKDNNQLGADAWMLNLGFRFKFNGHSKDHMRNALPEAVAGKDYSNELAALQKQLDAAKADAQKANEAADKAQKDADKAKKALDDANKARADKDQDLQDQIDALKAAQAKSAAAQNVQKALENGEAAELKDVTFENGKAELTNEAKKVLDEVVSAMKANKNWTAAEVAGYTDNVGADELNKELSSQRAEAVKNYLVEKGIEAGKLNANGYGKENPVASNKTAAGRAKNRRVEIHFAK